VVKYKEKRAQHTSLSDTNITGKRPSQMTFINLYTGLKFTVHVS